MSGVTDQDLAKIRSMIEATTPGPWFLAYATVHDEPRTREFMRIEHGIPDDAPDEAYEKLPNTAICHVPVVAGDTPTAQSSRDATFIAAARTAVPMLLDEIKRLRESVECLEAARADVARQLAEMTSARDEACGELEDTGGEFAITRAAELRKIGSP